MNVLDEQLQCRAFSAGLWADGRFALSGSSPHYAPDRTLDTEHIQLDVALDFKRKTLKGIATTSLRALTDSVTHMVFDAVDFRDLQVTSPQRPVKHEYDGRKLKVLWAKPLKTGDPLTLVVSYRVTQPKLGLYFIGPDKAYPTKPVQAWTQGEDEYARYWFPCHDAPQERTTTEVLLTVPERFTGISNGALLRTSRNARQKTRTFHWRQDIPHSPYLVSLAVGEFSKIEDRWRKVPVLYFVPPGREEDAKRAFGQTPKMMEFFSKRLGVPYAYAKYSQVAAIDFIYGGMENTSSTTQTALTLHDERAHLDFSSDPLVAHELAHQWFGDLVTCKDWSHAWLNESFATYFEALFKEHDRGHDEFMYELYENAQSYFGEDRERYRRAMVTHTYKNPTDLFDRHLYEKGSLILHMLRRILGDEAWWRSMNTYLRTHKTRGVETVDLIDAIQAATGRNLRPFFDQWIYKGGHPEYRLRWWWDAKAKKAFVRVLQTQTVGPETGLFSMPIEFAFYTDTKTKHAFTEQVDKKEHLFSFTLPSEPVLVLFDPNHTVLKKVDFTKTEAMWIFQLQHDPHVLGRLEAAQHLGRLATLSAVEALSKALMTESFWGTQSEIARTLGRVNAPAALDALRKGLQRISHPKVRRALIEALGNYPSDGVKGELRSLIPQEASYFAEAETIRALGRMKSPELLEFFRERLQHESWNDVLRVAALDAITALNVPESVGILQEYSRYGHHPNARMTAIRGLGALGQGRDDIQKFLIPLLEDPYLLVQLAVVRALGNFADERAVDDLLKYTTGDLDGRLKRTAEEAIRKIRKGMEPEMPPTPESKEAAKKGFTERRNGTNKRQRISPQEVPVGAEGHKGL